MQERKYKQNIPKLMFKDELSILLFVALNEPAVGVPRPDRQARQRAGSELEHVPPEPVNNDCNTNNNDNNNHNNNNNNNNNDNNDSNNDNDNNSTCLWSPQSQGPGLLRRPACASSGL